MALRNQPHEPRAGTYYTIERRLDFSMQDTWQKFLPGISPSPSLRTRSSHSTNPA
jgi:hypothetical protein